MIENSRLASSNLRTARLQALKSDLIDFNSITTVLFQKQCCFRSSPLSLAIRTIAALFGETQAVQNAFLILQFIDAPFPTPTRNANPGTEQHQKSENSCHSDQNVTVTIHQPQSLHQNQPLSMSQSTPSVRFSQLAKNVHSTTPIGIAVGAVNQVAKDALNLPATKLLVISINSTTRTTQNVVKKSQFHLSLGSAMMPTPLFVTQ